MRYLCIDRCRDQYPIRMMCRVLKVSKSGYYAWRTRPESARAKTDRELTRVIRRLHGESNGVYGSPKIREELKDEGYHYGRHKVARLMRIAGLRGCPKRCFRVTTKRDPSHPVANNLLAQDFATDAPNQRWAADITYLATNQGWLYLAVVMDLYSRRIVGWSMNRWINRHLVIDALRMALDARQPAGALIHHSDSENVIAGSFWWSDLVNVRHNRVSGAGRPWVA
jgi:putative transposase